MTFPLVPLCLWREARGGGFTEMSAVACVIRNRAKRKTWTMERVVMFPLAFSSMTAPRDPQLQSYPTEAHQADWAAWLQAEQIADAMTAGTFADITVGATLYYDISIPFPPHWDHSKVEFAVKIGRLMLWREL